MKEYQSSTEKPWDQKRAAHLLKRAGYGAHIDRINKLLQLTPSEAVDRIIKEAKEAAMPVTPEWIDETPPYPFNAQYAMLNQEWISALKVAWTDEMRKAPLRERMVFFWRNHFVIGNHNDIFAPLWFRYLTLLRQHAFGNFKEFVKAIGLDSGMLIYLDGQLNTRRNNRPQENYARELLELFLMGIKNKHGEPNYTQQDIVELAKAFSGWHVRLRPEFEVRFDPDRFFDEEKKLLGRTGNFGYDEAIDVLFEERSEEIAYHICRKLYCWFVYDDVKDEIVDQMTEIFLSSDFEIMPVLTSLLKSEHFFDQEWIGAKIKSPLEFLNALYVETGTEPDASLKEHQERWLIDLGQDPMDVPNVAGWQGYHLWLDNTTVARRWEIVRQTLAVTISSSMSDMGNANELVSDSGSTDNRLNVIKLAKKIAGSDVNDPEKLAKHLTTYFIGVPLPENETVELKEIMLNGIPEDEWDADEPGAHQKITEFISYLREMPEYNLF